MNEAVKALLEANRLLTEQIVVLTAQIVALSQPRDALPAGEWVPVAPEPAFESRRLHTSEEEEDLQHLFDTGQITREELKEALQQAGFANTGVEIA